MEAAGVEPPLVGGGDRDDDQLLVERQLLEALDDAPDALGLDGNGGIHGHLLHVVDEQRDGLTLVAPGDLAEWRGRWCGLLIR